MPGTNVPRLRPVPLGPRAVGFFNDELQDLIEALPAAAMEAHRERAHTKTWRDTTVVHPLANEFPSMSDVELKELAEDIRKNRQREPVVFAEIGGVRTLIDGRHRLDACAMIGEKAWETTATELKDDAAIRAFIISHNVHRRHLTSEKRRELIARVLKTQPEQSNRAIAAQVKADDKTVGAVRQELESRAEIPHVAKRTDKKGRKQPAAKSKKKGAAPAKEAGVDQDGKSKELTAGTNITDGIGAAINAAAAAR